MKRFLSLLLILATLTLAFASCGKRPATETTAVPETTAAESDGTTAEATTDKWEEPALAINRLAARDRQLKIECSEYKTAEKASKNDIYLKGPDDVEDGVTPGIQMMVYERNRAADALFGTTTEFVFWDFGWGAQAPQIDLVVKGNAADAGAINVNTNPRKARALSAYLQYCTERSPEIRKQFLEIVTKYKTTVYNQGTDRMLNIIYKGIVYGRDKTVDDLVGGDRWHQLIKNENFGVGADYITSRYEALRSSKQKTLDDDLKKWYTLPTVENPAE